MRRIKLDRNLTRMTINGVIGEVEEVLGEMQAQRKSAIKTQLELEEVLISCLEKFGEGGRFDVSCFRRFGKINVRVAFEGAPFNPTEGVSESAALLMRLVAMEDFSPRWDWQNGIDTIEFPVESAHPPMSLTLMMLYALGGAAVLGFVALFLPSGIRNHLVGFADPTFGILLEIIKGVAGPFIFARPPCVRTAQADAEKVFTKLRERNIFIRYFKGPKTGDRVRITIGTDAQMRRVLCEIDDIL